MQLIVMIILALGCCVAANASLGAIAGEKPKKALILKACASACFLGAGIIARTGCWYTRFGYFVLAGLACGFVGDILLGLRFVEKKKYRLCFEIGAAFFAVGHILYAAALLSFTVKVLYIAVPYAAVGFAVASRYLKKQKIKARDFRFAGCVYEVLLLFMAGCSAGAAVFALSPGTILFAVGGLFFALSDNLLAAESFGKKRDEDRRRAVYILYYSAQIFIAFSMIMLFVL